MLTLNLENPTNDLALKSFTFDSGCLFIIFQKSDQRVNNSKFSLLQLHPLLMLTNVLKKLIFPGHIIGPEPRVWAFKEDAARACVCV